MAYADFAFYQNGYFGTSILPGDFPRLAERGAEYIDAATSGRAGNASGAVLDKVKKANCALAEILRDEEFMYRQAFSENKAISGETVGGYSVSYRNTTVSTAETDAITARRREALLTYLSNTGLLRMAVIPCTHRTR